MKFSTNRGIRLSSRPNLNMYDRNQDTIRNDKKFEKYSSTNEYFVNRVRNRMKAMTYKQLVFLLKKENKKSFNFLPWSIEALNNLSEEDYQKVLNELKELLQITVEIEGDRRSLIRNCLIDSVNKMLDDGLIFTTFGDKK